MSQHRARREHLTGVLLDTLGKRLKAPLGIVLGSPLETAELVERFVGQEVVCYQMDMYQAYRLDMELRERDLDARILTLPDLWDVPQPLGTLLYPVPQGGERHLKIDMIEQSFHALAPHGVLAVMSPFEKEQFFQPALKKVFGKVHAPMAGNNNLLWCQREGERPRRRHEVGFQVRVREGLSVRFLSRPGVFSYGRFDDGARALMEIATFQPGQRVLDFGCGVGTNGILAALHRGKEGHTAFLDSNVRAVALAELNARTIDIGSFATKASPSGEGFEEESFDIVLANPPYFAQMSIAERFIEQGKQYLKRGGTLYLVTRQVEQAAGLMEKAFGQVEGMERRGYVVFQGVA